jgi:hypothetical protein
MRGKIYAVGDTVTLKADLFRTADSDRLCRIVGRLPSDHGEVQYRVRLGNETHERRVVASDIEATAAAEAEDGPLASPTGREPWFKPSSIRITK